MTDPLTPSSERGDHLRNMIGPVVVVLVVYALALGVFALAYGWGRVTADFWPPDASRVGPNIVASFVLVLALIAHNEWITEERARRRHETHAQALSDAVENLLHPTEEAEATIAAEIEAQFKQDVLDRLDCATPGGIGALMELLNKEPP